MQSDYMEVGPTEPAGDVGARRPAGEEEVEDEHGGHGHVAKLPVGVLAVEVVDRLLPCAIEQGGRLAVAAIPQHLWGKKFHY